MSCDGVVSAEFMYIRATMIDTFTSQTIYVFRFMFTCTFCTCTIWTGVTKRLICNRRVMCSSTISSKYDFLSQKRYPYWWVLVLTHISVNKKAFLINKPSLNGAPGKTDHVFPNETIFKLAFNSRLTSYKSPHVWYQCCFLPPIFFTNERAFDYWTAYSSSYNSKTCCVS